MTLRDPRPAVLAGHEGLDVHLRRSGLKSVALDPGAGSAGREEPHPEAGALMRGAQGDGRLHVPSGAAGDDGDPLHVVPTMRHWTRAAVIMLDITSHRGPITSTRATGPP